MRAPTTDIDLWSDATLLDPYPAERGRRTRRSTEAGVREGVTFETASERLAWLNDAVALGAGTLTGDHLTVELFLLTS